MGYYGWEDIVDIEDDYVTMSQYVSKGERYTPIWHLVRDLIDEIYEPVEGKTCPHHLHYLFHKLAGELSLEIPDNIPMRRTA